MVAEESHNSEMLRTMFDAIPSLIFVVDHDVRIEEYNAAAGKLLVGERETILKRRGGEILNCLHSKDTPEGCGHSTYCNTCVIRNSVTDAFKGNSVVRRRSKIELVRGKDTLEIYALITASPFRFKTRALVLLVIEDINEISELQRMIPICSICKEVRDEKEAWSRIEAYFKEQWDVDFSHSICPKCYQSEMEKIEKALGAEPSASAES